jgi:hypothetical protein
MSLPVLWKGSYFCWIYVSSNASCHGHQDVRRDGWHILDLTEERIQGGHIEESNIFIQPVNMKMIII